MRWSYACYGKANSFAQMNCPWGTRVSFQKVAFGAKSDPSCPLETDFFTPLGCCVPECGDCFVEDIAFREHIIQQSTCDGKTGCSVRAQRTSTADCSTKPFSNYMVVMYDCVPDSVLLPNQLPLFPTTVEEELCASQTFNRPYDNWQQADHTGTTPNSSHRQQINTPTLHAGGNTSATINQSATPDIAREGAIIGALVGGATLLIAVVLVIVICCCIRWRSDEEDVDVENKSNLSFIDPLTLQPSYHAFGSVDGSSMAEQVQTDDLSVWSVSTDQYGSVKMDPTIRGPDDGRPSGPAGRWFEQGGQINDGFAPPSVPSRRIPPKGQHGGADAKSRSQARKGSRKQWNISAIARKDRGIRKSKNRSGKLALRDGIVKFDHNSAASCKRRTKDHYYKGKALALKELSLPQYSGKSDSDSQVGVGPPVSNRGFSSWWLLNAMRSGSEPITRFQQRTETNQQFGNTGNRRKV